MIRYKIFVIFHNDINISYYDKSILDNLIFVNVNPNNRYNYPGLKVINLYEIENFIPLGKWYTESEVIYNVYKQHLFLNDIDFVGFTHYDINFQPVTDNELQQKFNTFDLINLQPYTLREDFEQKILMDPNQPNRLRGRGRNCYLSIIDDFNEYYGANFSINDYIEKAQINLCSSFVVKKSAFIEMMVFISSIIESGKLNKYDINHKYRIQGGFLERYYAIWLLLRNINFVNFQLKHEFVETNNQTPLLRKVKRIFLAFLNNRIKSNFFAKIFTK